MIFLRYLGPRGGVFAYCVGTKDEAATGAANLHLPSRLRGVYKGYLYQVQGTLANRRLRWDTSTLQYHSDLGGQA